MGQSVFNDVLRPPISAQAGSHHHHYHHHQTRNPKAVATALHSFLSTAASFVSAHTVLTKPCGECSIRWTIPSWVRRRAISGGATHSEVC